jgi:hypothetical protein
LASFREALVNKPDFGIDRRQVDKEIDVKAGETVEVTIEKGAR